MLIGGFVTICASTRTSHRLYEAAGALFITGGKESITFETILTSDEIPSLHFLICSCLTVSFYMMMLQELHCSILRTKYFVLFLFSIHSYFTLPNLFTFPFPFRCLNSVCSADVCCVDAGVRFFREVRPPAQAVSVFQSTAQCALWSILHAGYHHCCPQPSDWTVPSAHFNR